MHYLTLVAIAKDETRHLREWLVYHALLGVEAFIIYDNESRIPIRETLAPFLRNGFLTIVELPGKNRQLQAYDHALNTFGATTRWMGFIDLDEYLVPQATDDLRHFLADYEAHAGLVVNWAMYGSGKHVKRPHGLMVENYTQRQHLHHRDNHHVKSIVKPACALRALSPHHFAFRKGSSAVNADRLPCCTPYSPLCADKIRLNHYYYRSREEFEDKMRRGRADTNAQDLRRSMETFEQQLGAPHEEDRCALKYLDKLKTMLKADGAEGVIALARQRIAQDVPGYLAAFVEASRQVDADRADLILRDALVRYPDDPVLVAVRAGSLRVMGHTARAMAEAERSLAIRPTPQALSELVLLHAAQGEQAMADKLQAFQEFLASIGRCA